MLNFFSRTSESVEKFSLKNYLNIGSEAVVVGRYVVPPSWNRETGVEAGCLQFICRMHFCTIISLCCGHLFISGLSTYDLLISLTIKCI